MEIKIMIDILKKYWWVILLIISAPILINYLILKPAIFKFIGKDTDWLNFWGAYIGTILSSFIAFYVLHKQLIQNQNENENNRKLQINILNYQQKNQWLTELKVKLAEYYKSFSFNDINAIADRILTKETNVIIQIKETRASLKQIIDSFNIADFSKGIMFSNELTKEESKFIAKLKSYSGEFCALLEDIDWYMFEVYGHTGGDDMLKDMYVEETKSYQQEEHTHISQSRRIWDIIIEYDYKITSKNKEIISTRMKEAMLNIKADDIQKTIVALIDFEQETINNILRKKNDTEQ